MHLADSARLSSCAREFQRKWHHVVSICSSLYTGALGIKEPLMN